MDILVTFDQNYIPPFKTLLKSFMASHPNSQPTFWLLHKSIDQEALDDLENYANNYQAKFEAIKVTDDYFDQAKVTSRYPESMYYRLLAPEVLPDRVSRVIYLDSDILIINDLWDLWEMDLPENKAFAAASHSTLGKVVDNINNIRLDTDHPYFNSGVLLIDLERAREIIDIDHMMETVNQSKNIDLLLPDQDLFNSLYGKFVHEIPDELYNYDARFYPAYLLNSGNEYDLDWVIQNTKVLHFCGKRKPWDAKGSNIFNSLYKYFMYN